MNKALLAKVGWRLLHDVDSLWAKVLRSKYHVQDVHDQKWLKAKGTWSSTWRGICVGLREVILPGVSWVIADGKVTRFWKDKWLLDRPLIDVVTRDIPNEAAELRVCDYWRNGSGWMVEYIEPFLPASLMLHLWAIVTDTVTGIRDRLSWGESSDGQFTVIMTNVERQRRHLSVSGMCQVCKGGDETIIHILCDCPAMEGVWRRLVPLSKRREFFATSLLEWVYTNLGDDCSVRETTWATLFAITIWWGWKWRCINVFDGTGKCRDRVQFVKDQAKEVTMAQTKSGTTSSSVRGRVERQIKWTCPSDGWVKLNTDGASRGNPGMAAAGGVLWDERGSWSRGFALNIGVCNAPLAELWGVYYGLLMAWESKAQRVTVEVDSEMIVGFLLTEISDANPLSFLVRLCHGFISKDWIVRISHMYREANRLADGLANYAFSLPLGFHSFVVVPDAVKPVFIDDMAGVATPRRVRL
ncbi:unnamed protein product [Microthlaspi erraticum]|uniref:RNase H type-1 domain-containing protein n=1 Tax=Microthlaspi erraticum TaxID=1685480 RepID=A0A6D2II60_9BRAS|nr:unnamed protein product [Microthlaspi erraticum]